MIYLLVTHIVQKGSCPIRWHSNSSWLSVSKFKSYLNDCPFSKTFLFCLLSKILFVDCRFLLVSIVESQLQKIRWAVVVALCLIVVLWNQYSRNPVLVVVLLSDWAETFKQITLLQLGPAGLGKDELLGSICKGMA